MSLEESKLDLSRIVFIGRTYEEYLAMFGLTEEELAGLDILDCPGGACAFTAGASRAGARAVSSDIAYEFPARVLEQKGQEDIVHTLEKMESARAGFRWDYFRSVDELAEHRHRALRECTEDMELHPERYVPAVLPKLPFEDGRFDLTLSGHFLFIYGDRLDYEFHLSCLHELLRVTRRELRIFPLIGLAGQRYERLDELILAIRQEGFVAREIEVPYEFQKGTGQMLSIIRQ
ncbi:hypothetical protein D3C81_440610 [compost metagenome]